MARPRLETSDWWPQLLELHERLPLKELAERFGVSVNGLSRALKRAGVDHRPVRSSEASGGADASPDPRSAEAQEWCPEFLALKDRHSLAKLARRFGVAEITLQRALKRTGVERRSQRGARAGRESRKSARAIKPFAELLGKVPDGEVARQAGVSRYAVAQYRKRRDIPSVRSGSPAAAPLPPVVGEGVQAWVVSVTMASGRVRTFVVAGACLTSAVQAAEVAIPTRLASSRESWTITGLELAGPPL